MRIESLLVVRAGSYNNHFKEERYSFLERREDVEDGICGKH